MTKVNFITLNSNQVKGLRVNIDRIRTYAKSDDCVVSLAWDTGISTDLRFSTKAEADAALAELDAKCL